MQIEQVSNKQQLDEFIRFPWKVYQGNAHWVPPLLTDMQFQLSDKNPFFLHAEAAFFLARDKGKVAGRIAAIVDRNHINVHKEQCGFFGYFECLPEPAAARGLIDAAASWLKQRELVTMRGPMNPSTNDECGFLLRGHDARPMIMMPYTPPYYLDQMEQCGMAKAKDLYAFITVIKEVSAGDRLERLASLLKKKVPGLVVRPANMKQFGRELNAVKEIYNSAWSHNWGFVPMTDKEIDSMAGRLKPLIQPELLIMAEVDGRPAGFFMAVPDYNQVLARINGRLGPIGLMKFLWYRRRISDIRVLTLGVKEEYRRKGIEGLLYLQAFKAALGKGYERAEMSWVLEDNELMKKGCELMGGSVYKKYRIYEKRI